MKHVKIPVILILLFLATSSSGPPNCNLYKDDPDCYEACMEAERAIQHPQGSRPSQAHFNRSIALCPTFDYSYFEKGVPYAKRGLMREWRVMIDQAIALDPEEHLAIRGWYHFFFMNNYEGALADIDSLEKIIDYDLAETGDGTYHFNVMKALCYKGLGQNEKAITVIAEHMHNPEYYQGIYDYLHLGVLYLEEDHPASALDHFKKQMDYNDISEAHYYSALAYELLGEMSEYRLSLERALELYDQEMAMNNPYRYLPDEVFRSDITGRLDVNPQSVPVTKTISE